MATLTLRTPLAANTISSCAFDTDVKKLRVGYLKADFESRTTPRKGTDQAALDALRKLGVELVPLDLHGHARPAS